MKDLFLKKIRLTVYFWTLLLIFTILAMIIPRQKFSSGALALFSVNSFLYGFYIAPILSGQKARVEDLHRVVRSEANAIFSMAISLKSLPGNLRNHLQAMLTAYLNALIHDAKAAGGEEEYEAMITYCVEYEGAHKGDVLDFLDKLVANQKNRTDFSMQIHNPVFSNEWSIMLVLFSITLSFVISLDAGDSLIYRFLAALLCTGLSMLLIILVKLSSLTHKKAKAIWDPYKKLINSHYYRIDS